MKLEGRRPRSTFFTLIGVQRMVLSQFSCCEIRAESDHTSVIS